MPDTKPSPEMWEDVVRSMYMDDVTEEEFENKCRSNPGATRKIAYYFRETGYDLDQFASSTEAQGQVVFLFDFLNFTDGI